MLTRFRLFLAPPVFIDNEEKTRLAKVLSFMIWTLFVSTIFFCVIWLFNSPEQALRIFYALPLLPMALYTHRLLKHRKIESASLVMVLGMWFTLFISAVFNGGIQSLAISGFIAVVLVASTLLGQNAALFFTGLTILSNLGLVIAESAGLISGEQEMLPIAVWSAHASYLILSVIVLYMTTSNIRVALARSRKEIDDRKRVEEALRASEEKFNKAFYFSPVPMAISSPQRGYLDVNESFTKLLGIPQEKIIGRKAREVGMWLDQGLQQQAITLLQEKGQFRDFEFRFQKSDGEIRIALGSASILTFNGEQCAIASIFDITERKRSEEALKASEEKFQKAFVSSPIPMMINSPTRGILNVNRAFEELTNYHRAEILGRRAHEIGLWVNLSERQAAIEHVRNYGSLADFEFKFRKKDGEERLGSLAVDLIDIEDEKCYLASFQDITTRKEAEEALRIMNAELEKHVQKRTAQLEAANRELESFSYSVSHDLRTPLRAINGFSRLLVEDYQGQLPPEAARLLNLVQDNALKMGRLIDDLLSFSRLGRSPILMRIIFPKDLVNEVWDDLAHERSNRNIKLVVHDLEPCQADPSLFRLVISNLLGNAIKFTRPRELAQIEVGNTHVSGKNVYFVKDNGAGFEMEYAHKLFGVFQRLHHEGEFEGTGVGLATVQRIIHRHGGEIWADSEPDHGAIFFFTLPPVNPSE